MPVALPSPLGANRGTWMLFRSALAVPLEGDQVVSELQAGGGGGGEGEVASGDERAFVDHRDRGAVAIVAERDLGATGERAMCDADGAGLEPPAPGQWRARGGRGGAPRRRPVECRRGRKWRRRLRASRGRLIRPRRSPRRRLPAR